MMWLENFDSDKMEGIPVSRELSAISHWPINLISWETSAALPDRYVDADLICRRINFGHKRNEFLLWQGSCVSRFHSLVISMSLLYVAISDLIRHGKISRSLHPDYLFKSQQFVNSLNRWFLILSGLPTFSQKTYLEYIFKRNTYF